jgi:hypothetical protein
MIVGAPRHTPVTIGAYVKIPEWVPYIEQMCTIGRHRWSVPRLVELSSGLPVMEVPLDAINVYNRYSNLTLREMVMHMRAVHSADLSYPIILDEDGELMDGRHRIMKAMHLKLETIKVVRFQTNPKPCKVEDQ